MNLDPGVVDPTILALLGTVAFLAKPTVDIYRQIVGTSAPSWSVVVAAIVSCALWLFTAWFAVNGPDPNWRLVAGGAIAVFILATSITGVTTLARAGDVARASGDRALREERK